MRRFQSTPVLGLRTPAGSVLEVWVAEAFHTRLVGLAGAPALPAARALLIPRCTSVHTIGMRFAIDVAFMSWPRVGDACEVGAVFEDVPPLRFVSLPGVRRGSVAALEAASGALRALAVGQGARLPVVFEQKRGGYTSVCITVRR
jgi:hypothetical protein